MLFLTLQHTIPLTTTRPRYFMRVSEFFLSSDKILVNSRRGNRPMWSETLRRQHPLQFFRTSFSDFYSIKNWFLVLFFSVILLTEKGERIFFLFLSKKICSFFSWHRYPWLIQFHLVPNLGLFPQILVHSFDEKTDLHWRSYGSKSKVSEQTYLLEIFSIVTFI